MSLFERTTAINTHGVIKVSRPWESAIREGRIVITPDLAQKILADSNYEGQRRVDHRSVNVYAEMMRRGLWELADPISFARLYGNLTLVNGQHRLHGVVAYGRDVEFRVAVNDCDTPEEVRALYYRFDAVMRVRTADQVLNAIGLAESENVSRSIARAVYGAVGVIANGFQTPSNNTLRGEAIAKTRIVDLRVEACKPWWEAARKLQECLKAGQGEITPRIRRATTFAVALLTVKYQPEKAIPFWRGVAENDGLKRTDVRHLFVRDLLSRDVSVNAHDQGILTAATAWNAWFEGRPLKIIKVVENQTLRIAGTPIGGRR